jgi:DNA-binding transcriptional MerR regulator
MSPLPEVHLGSDEPLYNIGVVSRMTGVSMATLRAWERRYSFPESERTSGGHRLYSENDILELRWVKGRIDEGMQTAQAINALHHQENVGNLTLVDQMPTPGSKAASETGPHLKACEEQLLKALLIRNLVKADSALGEALALSSPEDLILDVIGPALSNIGAAWENGETSVATEHLATNYLRQRLLMWMISGPPPRNTAPIMLACAPDEWHEGSLLVLGALLRRRRWPVSYLGQSLPLPDLASFVKEINPLMVILVAMTEQTATNLSEWPHWLPKAAQNGKPVIGFGGRIFTIQPEWRMRVAGTYLGDTFRAGLDNIERLLVHAS